MATETIDNKVKEITIFTKYAGKDGQGTLMFYDCEVLQHVGENNLMFTYVSRSTGQKKRASFCTSNIAGYSYTI